MKTFLPQNEFMSSASHVPIDVVPAADSPLPPSKSAAAISVSAVAFPPPPACDATIEAEAVASVRTAAASDISDISDIPEIFRVANLLCVEAREFLPDYPGIYQAMMDPNAPRATDDVWSDLVPLFLREPS